MDDSIFIHAGKFLFSSIFRILVRASRVLGVISKKLHCNFFKINLRNKCFGLVEEDSLFLEIRK